MQSTYSTKYFDEQKRTSYRYDISILPDELTQGVEYQQQQQNDTRDAISLCCSRYGSIHSNNNSFKAVRPCKSTTPLASCKPGNNPLTALGAGPSFRCRIACPPDSIMVRGKR